MALTDIVTIAEVLVQTGRSSDVPDEEEEMLSQLKAPIEQRVRQYLGSSITQEAAQTVYLPEINAIDAIWSNSQYTSYAAAYGGAVLKLPDWPIRTVTALYEDRGGYSGTGTNAFSSNSELTAGRDFAIDLLTDGYCESGDLIRLGQSWPATPRSVKVTFTAGWTADELCGDVTDPKLDASVIRQAVLAEFTELWGFLKQEQQAVGDNAGASGPILSEKLGDYAVTFANAAEWAAKFEATRGPADLGSSAMRWLAKYGQRGMQWVI